MSDRQRPHVARKRFGQHFLTDRSVLDRIVRALSPRSGQTIVEIGPGLGALTDPLLEAIDHLTVIELDRDLAGRLTERYPPDRLTVIQQDILNASLAEIKRQDSGQKLRLIGNLPYNISTPLVFHLLEQREQIQDMVFMVQREVAVRLAARAGSKQYGRLSVMAALSLDTELLFDVPPEAFDPPPRVDSTVIRLIPREMTFDPALLPVISRVVAAAFGQRRKTLRNALSEVADESTLFDAGIDPGDRAEVLEPEDYVRLAATMSADSP